MDISDVALTQTLISQLSAQSNSIAQLQEQIATGQALNQPSDNPAAVTQVLALSSQAGQLASFQNNADTASSWLETANSTANSVLDEMQSAQSILLQAANEGTQDATTYQALGDQLNGIVTNLIGLANTQYAERAIFAGTSASTTAYDQSGNYLGNGDAPTVVIGPGSGSGQAVAISVAGTSLFGAGAASVFSTLSSVAAALTSGTPSSTSISSAISALATNLATAQQASAALGNAAEEVTSATSSLTTQITNVQASQSNLEDVNVATATTQMESETTNYQAALWAAAQSLPDTLVKFLAP